MSPGLILNKPFIVIIGQSLKNKTMKIIKVRFNKKKLMTTIKTDETLDSQEYEVLVCLTHSRTKLKMFYFYDENHSIWEVINSETFDIFNFRKKSYNDFSISEAIFFFDYCLLRRWVFFTG